MTGLAHRGFSLNDYGKHIVHTLRRAGYRTGAFGKVHLTPECYTRSQLKSDVPILDWRRFADDATAASWNPAGLTYLRVPEVSLVGVSNSFDVTRGYTFWSGVVGGAFLTTATHGTDQLMVQRYLCADNPRHARAALDAEGYRRVRILTSDGYKGWPEYNPFDAIIVTCAPDEVPGTLVDQLKEGGRLIVPVGRGSQRLVILRKQRGQVEQEEDLPVRFVPMVRE